MGPYAILLGMSYVDQNSDAAYAVLVNQAKRFPKFAEYVKTAELDSNEVKTLPESAFAFPECRQFPVYSDKAAAVSYAYAITQKLPVTITERIKEALEVFGIDPCTMFSAPIEKVAAETNPYLLPDLKLFAVRSASDVKTAQEHLLENITKLDLVHRATA